MKNYYAIVLGLLTVGGMGVTAWGLLGLHRLHRRRRTWPTIQATIRESRGGEDILPTIVYRYEVGDSVFERTLELPSGTEPSEELTNDLLRRYPVGSAVQVRYDPEAPERAEVVDLGGTTDWFIVAIGAATTGFGLYALLH